MTTNAPAANAETTFAAFSEIVDHLDATWTMWRTMFGDLATEDDHDTFAKASPDVFQYVRWHWLTSVTLGLAKLADRDSMRGRENLTLQRIYDETVFATDSDRQDARSAMDFALGEIEQDAFRKVRHRIAST